MSEASVDDAATRIRIEAMVQRAIRRNIKGLALMNAPAPPVGLTPKDVIYERGTLRLYHYHARADEIYRVPVLLVMATTNKAFLFDLAPRQSMVEYLLDQGFDVFVIDWAAPTPAERGLTLADYTQDFIPTCVQNVQQHSGEHDVSVIGYCAGGVLSVIYAATHAEGPLKNLVCLTTPIDYHEMKLMRTWSDERYLDIDAVVDTLGIIPADMILQSFEMLRPAQKRAGQIRVWEQLWNDEFVDQYRVMERWGNETLPLAGEYYRETTRELMWNNKLLTGELVVRGKRVDLRKITVPIMTAVAEHDHIVPYAASKPLLDLVGSTDKQEVRLKGGHVSLIAGANASRRMWPRLSQWLAERSV